MSRFDVLPNPNAKFIEQKAYDPDNFIDPSDEYVNERVSPISSSPNCARIHKPVRANVGKPVTRTRQELTVPQREALDQGQFKVLPITPRATKPPGWKLGSGFDGITLEPALNMGPRTSHGRSVGHARNPRFLGKSVLKLDFSTELSPTRQHVGQSGVPDQQESHHSPVESRKSYPARRLSTADGAFEDRLVQSAASIGEKAESERAANWTALSCSPTNDYQSGTAFSSHHDCIIKDTAQVRLSQSRNLDASQTIRGPSKSERNGWLKRKKVNFALSDEDEGWLSFRTRTLPVNRSGRGGRSEKNLVVSCLKDITQAQHAAENDIEAFQEARRPHKTPNEL